MSVEEYVVTLQKRHWLDETTFVLTCNRPAGFFFVAGQHVTLLAQEEAREYSLLSAPASDTLRFLIKRIEDGRLSRVLSKLEAGAQIGMSKANGYLQYSPVERPVYFVATGVGIAPFVSMAAAGVRNFTLVQGARTEQGLFYREELSRAADTYIPCISGGNAKESSLANMFPGRVTDYIKENLQPGAYDFYLCGSRPMIHDMTRLLDEYFPETRIFSESFT